MANVQLRTASDADGKASEILTEMEATGRVLPILRAVANSQAAFAPFLRYARALLRELTVPARTRELVIMRAAERLHSPYEWGEHLGFARKAGVSEAELRALETGDIPASVSDLERRCLTLVDAVVDAEDAAEWKGADVAADLSRDLGPVMFTELALILGWWAGSVPVIVRVLGLDGADTQT